MSQDKPVLSRSEIEEVRKRLQGYYWPDRQNRHQSIDALCDLALAALDRQGWIRVEERLPTLGTDILVWRRSKVEADYYCRPDWFEDHGVTHWMPLPPAPGAKKEE